MQLTGYYDYYTVSYDFNLFGDGLLATEEMNNYHVTSEFMLVITSLTWPHGNVKRLGEGLDTTVM